jgi:hypothetical protein
MSVIYVLDCVFPLSTRVYTSIQVRVLIYIASTSVLVLHGQFQHRLWSHFRLIYLHYLGIYNVLVSHSITECELESTVVT